MKYRKPKYLKLENGYKCLECQFYSISRRVMDKHQLDCEYNVMISLLSRVR